LHAIAFSSVVNMSDIRPGHRFLEPQCLNDGKLSANTLSLRLPATSNKYHYNLSNRLSKSSTRAVYAIDGFTAGTNTAYVQAQKMFKRMVAAHRAAFERKCKLN
jgi:hypothetical protein